MDSATLAYATLIKQHKSEHIANRKDLLCAFDVSFLLKMQAMSISKMISISARLYKGGHFFMTIYTSPLAFFFCKIFNGDPQHSDDCTG